MAGRHLVLFMRLYGAVAAMAIVAVFMPRAWMASAHVAIGLGDFPDGSIVVYLARSTSAFYALLGVLLWFMSFEPARYLRLIRGVAILGIAAGPLLFIMDTNLLMPPMWRLSEGPMVVVISAILLALQSRYHKSITRDE
jgi:hypothetical protein